jgi:hypothetical protein
MKPPFLGVQQELRVGNETIIESDIPDGSRGVVFEDDGDTGYFYARDYAVPDRLFVDALHIYNVKGVIDREKPCRLKIIWTRDFAAAALLINQVPRAVFHFVERCGYATNPFPDPDPKTGWVHSSRLPGTRELFFPGEDTEGDEADEPVM